MRPFSTWKPEPWLQWGGLSVEVSVVCFRKARLQSTSGLYTGEFLVKGERGYSFLKTHNFICLWLCWASIGAQGLSLVWGSGAYSLLRTLWNTQISAVVGHCRLSRSAARGIFPDQGSNPRPLHWQVDSYPLSHLGSRERLF